MESFMNCKGLKFFIATVLLLLFNSHSFAQDSTDSRFDTSYTSGDEDSEDNLAEIPEDTLIIKTAFHSDDDSLQRWKHSRDFAYIMYLDSLLRKEKKLRMDTVSIDENTGKKRRASSSSTENNSDNFLNSFPLQIFFWAVAIFFIGFIIYKLFLTNGIFAKKSTKVAKEQIENEPEGLNEYSQYDSLIHEAETKSDYNLSTRYLYLQTLKQLADRELILYSPDKTNHSYIKELLNENYRKDFASLTLNYEYVWYGKFVIKSGHYQQLKEQFKSFNKKV